MDRTIGGEVEIREQAGREPMLRGVMLTEGRAASGGLAEVFAPLAVEWPSQGVGVLAEHGGPVESRGQPVRQRNGELTVTARATEGIKRAIAEGRRWMSVEFTAREERTTKGGVREILRALVTDVALEIAPEYDTTAAEVRAKNGPDVRSVSERAATWLK